MRGSAMVSCLLLACLSGCGFHLRGASQKAPILPYDTIYLQTSSSDDGITRLLQRQLSAYDVQIVSEGNTSAPRLILSPGDFSTQDLAYGTSGEVRRQRVTYTFSFKLQAADGSIILPEQILKVFRDQHLNPDQSLGDAYEQKMIEKEIQQDAVQLILFRLEASQAKS